MSEHTPWIQSVMHETTRTPEEVAHFAGPNEGYVLRAVNAHEDLLQIVKDLRFRSFDPTFKGWDFKRLDQVIAKAEEK